MSTNNTFIDLFLEFTQYFESPTIFWKWSAYGAIAASLRFNCYLKWGTANLYPNLFILLLADSASYRKDAGPELVEELLRENSHTKVISGRSSWQGIVDELANDKPGRKAGVPIRFGSGIIIATEFTAAFVNDPDLIKMMTESYSYKEEYEYILRGGTTKIKHRCVTLLGGSNETLLRDIYGVQATYGGLLRRTCLIKPDKRRPPNSFTDPNKHLTDGQKKQLLIKLQGIQSLKGEFRLSADAGIYYDLWYNDLYNSYDRIEDRTGFIQGIHTLIMKLAMTLAANENNLEITLGHIKTAIRELEKLKENYASYVMSSGKASHASIAAVLLSALWTCCNSTNGLPKGLKRREILFKYWNDIGAEDLDKLLVTLNDAGMVTLQATSNEPIYILTEVAKQAFLKQQKVQSAAPN